MYLIDPIPVTHVNGVLESSNVAYPDGTIGFLAGNYERWTRGRAYAVGTPVLHYGAVWINMIAIPADPPINSNIGLPPGHLDTWLIWIRQDIPAEFSPDVAYAEGELVSFPHVSYANRLPASAADSEWPAIINAAHVPTFFPVGYPAGMWRRNGVPDDGESIQPMYPSLASKYWDYMEPPLFQRLPEIPAGELTTYGGRVWRKRTPTMAAFEAPPSAPDDWALVRTSNRYAMFDGSVQSQTTQRAGSRWRPPQPAQDQVIEVVLKAPAGRIVDAVCLLNTAATSVRVRVATAANPSVIVYDKTMPMVATAMVISNWYDWFFAPRHAKRQALFDDIPATVGARVTITITNNGGQAACGACIFGKRIELGATLRGLELGLKNYSVKTEDEWGGMSVTRRGYSDRDSFPVSVHNDLLEPLKATMIDFRARPALWVGSPAFPSTIVYGYYKDLRFTVPYEASSNYTLEIEGLS
jgi:O6-methylguanine-DNA--protein-cysteine methyltransferase